MSNKVRAKFVCHSVIETEEGTGISMSAVYSEDPNHENKSFSDSSPSGNLSLHIAKGKEAAKAFVQGKEYYIDITLAEEKPEETAEAAQATAE